MMPRGRAYAHRRRRCRFPKPSRHAPPMLPMRCCRADLASSRRFYYRPNLYHRCYFALRSFRRRLDASNLFAFRDACRFFGLCPSAGVAHMMR